MQNMIRCLSLSRITQREGQTKAPPVKVCGYVQPFDSTEANAYLKKEIYFLVISSTWDRTKNLAVDTSLTAARPNHQAIEEQVKFSDFYLAMNRPGLGISQAVKQACDFSIYEEYLYECENKHYLYKYKYYLYKYKHYLYAYAYNLYLYKQLKRRFTIYIYIDSIYINIRIKQSFSQAIHINIGISRLVILNMNTIYDQLLNSYSYSYEQSLNYSYRQKKLFFSYYKGLFYSTTKIYRYYQLCSLLQASLQGSIVAIVARLVILIMNTNHD